jgi:hypothetical protein
LTRFANMTTWQCLSPPWPLDDFFP